MRRVVLPVVVLLLAVVAPASAKVGVELDEDPAALKAGEETAFTVMLMNEPTGGRGEPQPIEGVRPLVTFTNSKTGEVVRVRTGRTGHEGIAFGRVAFPSVGHWVVEMRAPGLEESLVHGHEFDVGGGYPVRVMETMEPPAPPPAAASPSEFPWLPLALAAGLLGFAAALMCFGPRRLRAHLPARFGGAA